MRRNDLTGRRFDYLKVVEYAGNDNRGNSTWLCECECGNSKVISGYHLLRGDIKSCGCKAHVFTDERKARISKAKTKHGLCNTRLYYIYDNMIKRCYNQSSEKYPNYGGRGITVCDEWKEDRTSFFEWAVRSGYNDRLTIDRIDVNGNYCPQNCKWSTQEEQANNRTSNRYISCNGETHTIAEWSKLKNIPAPTLYARVYRGWSVEKTLNTPLKKL